MTEGPYREPEKPIPQPRYTSTYGWMSLSSSEGECFVVEPGSPGVWDLIFVNIPEGGGRVVWTWKRHDPDGNY